MLPTKEAISIRDLDGINILLQDYLEYARNRIKESTNVNKELSLVSGYANLIVIASNYYNNPYERATLSRHTDEVIVKKLLLKRSVDEPIQHTECITDVNNFLTKSNTEDHNTTLKAIHFRITLMNEGNTDGLIRAKGELLFQGESNLLEIEKEPEFILDLPVHMNNLGQNQVEMSEIIGKVPKHSLTRVWFKAKNNNYNPIKDINANIELFDHDKSSISYKVLIPKGLSSRKSI